MRPFPQQMEQDSKYQTPGQLIQDLLEIKGWSQRILAIMMGVNETIISKTILGVRPVDAEMAIHLSRLFGFPAEAFLALQKSYDLAQARITVRPSPGTSNRAYLFGNLPISDMMKRGWITVEDVRNVSKVESELARFFKSETADDIEVLPHAAKKTNVAGGVTPAQLAWLYRV